MIDGDAMEVFNVDILDTLEDRKEKTRNDMTKLAGYTTNVITINIDTITITSFHIRK